MNALQIYHDAEWALEHNKITLGEFDERIKPLADVEAVVRCRDCRFHKDEGERDSVPAWLPCAEIETADDWFCADGKRKDNEINEP